MKNWIDYQIWHFKTFEFPIFILGLKRTFGMESNKMLTKRRNAVFGRYPCCDLVNNAIRCILHGDDDSAIEELLQAIYKADGYVHEDLKNDVQKIHERFWKKRTPV